MLTILIFVFLLVVIFHIFVFHKYNWPGYVRAIDKIPGPKGIFYFGSTLRFYLLKSEDMLTDLSREFSQWGSTFRYWYSGVAVVFVSDVNDIQTLLTSKHQSSKGMMYKNLLPWLGTGLLTSTGDKWRSMRKIITPTFHFSILQGFIQIFNNSTRVMVELLEKEVGNDACDLQAYLTYCTLDTICETAMGSELNIQSSQSNHQYVKSIFRIGQIIVDRMFSPVLFSNHNFALSSMGREQRKLLKTLHGFTSKIIQEKKLDYSSKTKEINFNTIKSDGEDPVDNIYYKKRSSFLEMLLEKQKQYSLTDQDIREEVDTFMFEGHDTTSTALGWTLFELGLNPTIQDKVHEELDKIFGDSDRDPTYQDLKDMLYLKRVIQEALRLYPSVPVISRTFEEDIQLQNYLVPAYTEIVFIIYHIHRNAAIYPDPDRFDPDRFLPEQIEKRNPFAYIPFSAGARNCVGQKFALLEELVMLSSIMRKFKVETLTSRDSVKVVPELTLRPNKRLSWRITYRAHRV